MKNENRTKKNNTYVRVMAGALVALLVFGIVSGVVATVINLL